MHEELFQIWPHPINRYHFTSNGVCQRPRLCFLYLRLSTAFLIISGRDVTGLKEIMSQSGENVVPGFWVSTSKSVWNLMTKSSLQLLAKGQNIDEEIFFFLRFQKKVYISFERFFLTVQRSNYTSFSNNVLYSFPEDLWQCITVTGH